MNVTQHDGQTYITEMWLEWDWNGWVKPQLDEAVAVGANAIRLIGDVKNIINGTRTRATYRAQWAQVADYCQANGLMLYPSLCAAGDDAVAFTMAELKTELLAMASYLDGWDCVIGFDIAQEGSLTFILQSQHVRTALRAVTRKPLSFSVTSVDIGVLRMLVGLDSYMGQTVQMVDFVDVHRYDTTAFLTGYFADIDLPIIMGEFGVPVAAGGAQATNLSTLWDMACDPRVAGGFQWSMRDQSIADTSNQYGLYGPSGTPHAALVTVFQAHL